MNQFQPGLSSGAFGESHRNKRAAKPGEFTIHPSSIDVVVPPNDAPFPKMIYKGEGRTVEDQKIVLSASELASNLEKGWRTTQFAVEPLATPLGELAADKPTRGRPRKSDDAA